MNNVMRYAFTTHTTDKILSCCQYHLMITTLHNFLSLSLSLSLSLTRTHLLSPPLFLTHTHTFSHLLSLSLSVFSSGDLSATTIAGRAVACVLEIIGVLGLALPVGVIGSELDRAYTKHFVRYRRMKFAIRILDFYSSSLHLILNFCDPPMSLSLSASLSVCLPLPMILLLFLPLSLFSLNPC